MQVCGRQAGRQAAMLLLCAVYAAAGQAGAVGRKVSNVCSETAGSRQACARCGGTQSCRYAGRRQAMLLLCKMVMPI